MGAVIDADIHNVVPKVEALFPYLATTGSSTSQQSRFKGPADTSYPQARAVDRAPDAARRTGPAGSTSRCCAQQVARRRRRRDRRSSTAPTRSTRSTTPTRRSRSPARSTTGRSPSGSTRSRACAPRSSCRASSPTMAAREIERVGDHPGFVQVLPAGALAAAATATGIHHPLFGRRSRPRPGRRRSTSAARPATRRRPPAGPRTTSRSTPAWPRSSQPSSTSMIMRGRLRPLPERCASPCSRRGFTWLPAHMWRFDKEWRNLRRLVPWVKRPPSEYIREHVRADDPAARRAADAAACSQIVEQLGSDEMLLYATDYPHLHADDAERDLLADLPDGLAAQDPAPRTRAPSTGSERVTRRRSHGRRHASQQAARPTGRDAPGRRSTATSTTSSTRTPTSTRTCPSAGCDHVETLRRCAAPAGGFYPRFMPAPPRTPGRRPAARAAPTRLHCASTSSTPRTSPTRS